MKLFIFSLCIVLSPIFLSAQNLTFGLNLYAASPQGGYNFLFLDENASSAPGIGLGTGFEMNYWFNTKFSLGFSYGDLVFQTAEADVPFLQFFSLPLKARALSQPIAINTRYHFRNGRWRPYVGFGVGYATYKVNKAAPTPAVFLLPAADIKISWRQDGFFITPQVGITYSLIETIQLHLGLQYQLAFNAVNGPYDIDTDGGLLSTAGLIPESGTQQTQIDATNNLYINLGLLFTLFEKQEKQQKPQNFTKLKLHY